MTAIKVSGAAALGEATIGDFRSLLSGELIRPGDEGYDSARRVWNGMIDRRPALIVRCRAEDDVVHALQFAASHNLRVAVRGGGHNVAGFGTCDDGIVIDLSPLKGITVNAAEHTARAQAGLTWGEFDQATQAHGLATTGGLVSTTGIAGFTLGGGFGWLVRKHGMTVDNLLSVDMVLADGRRVTANGGENADLFWGVRGGGGNFGIVTSFTYNLHPVGPTVYGGAIFYPIEQATELLRFYREWTRTQPDELTSMVAFLAAPPVPFVPKELVGTQMAAVAMCYAGSLEAGEQAVKPLRAALPPGIDHVGPVPYVRLQTMFDATAPYGIHSYWKSEYLRALDDGAIKALVENASRLKSLSPFSVVHLHHWEGGIKRATPQDMAFAHRAAPYVLNVIGAWTAGEDAEQHTAWVREFAQAMQPSATGQAYSNFLGAENNERTRAAYGPNYARLVELKKKYDPTNLFRLNQNISPGG